MKPFTLQEIDLILTCKENPYKNFLGVAFFTGARTGEILALEWKDIDFENLSLKKPALDVLYIITFTFAMYFLFKKKQTKE